MEVIHGENYGMRNYDSSMEFQLVVVAAAVTAQYLTGKNEHHHYH